MESQVSISERDRRKTNIHILIGAVDQNTVPINLKIGRDADALGSLGKASAEIGDHSAWKAGGETHVVDHANPFPVRVERFHIGRDGLYAGLIRSVHSGGCEVFNLSMQQKPERAAAVGFSKIEFETVQLGETFEREQFEIADIAMGLQIRENIVPAVIPGAGWRTRVAAGYDLERRIRRT